MPYSDSQVCRCHCCERNASFGVTASFFILFSETALTPGVLLSSWIASFTSPVAITTEVEAVMSLTSVGITESRESIMSSCLASETPLS